MASKILWTDKAVNTPTLLDRFTEEIDWLGDEFFKEQSYLNAIAAKDYVKAAECQHDMMILQYHREFIPRIKDAIVNNTLDALMSGLMNYIMYPSMSSDHPRPYELAKLDAAREHWKLVNKILKARDNAST
jgi:hypothetical protein